MVARQLGGRPIDDSSLLWKTLFPTETLRIDGRVSTENSCNFLTQTRLNPTKELIAVAFSPANGENGQNFKAISDFLIGKGCVGFIHVREMTTHVPRSRHGLIFPWGMPPKEHSPGRELYVVPLRATDPLPECIELLDHLKLPKERNNDCLIGVWILYKDRLAPPQIQPIPPATQAPPLPPLTANIASTMFGSPPSAPPIDTSALVKGVAALTSEQIQNVLRSLTVTPQMLPPRAPHTPQAPGQHPPPLPPLHPMSAMPMLPQQLQPWSAHPPVPYPAPYHPTLSMHPPTPPLTPGSHGPGGPPSFDRQDQREFKREPKPPGSGSDRNDRGPRRSRGRRGRDGGTSPRRPVDSGWPQRKAWAEARGGGPPSPTRKW